MQNRIQTYKQLTDSAPILCFSVDCDLRYTYVNPFFSKVHGISLQEALGKTIEQVIGQEGFLSNLPRYKKALEGETIEYESFFTKRDGNPHYYRAVYTPIEYHGAIQGFTGIVIDITAEKELKRLSRTDPLTNLHNRRSFESNLAHLLKVNSESQHGLIFLDIDFFKAINDQFGHSVGDRALISIGELLKKNTQIRNNAYRIGGEEFAVIFPNIEDQNTLLEAAEHIRRTIETSTIIPERQLTASIGAALFKAGDERHTLLKRVDIALYQSKDSGRNQVCCI